MIRQFPDIGVTCEGEDSHGCPIVLFLPGGGNGWDERTLLVDKRPDHMGAQQLRQRVAQLVQQCTVGDLLARILRKKTLVGRNLEI